MNSKGHAQINITVSQDERLEFDEQYERLLKELNELKRKGTISKHKVFKRNDVAKLAFRLGIELLLSMSFQEFIDKLEDKHKHLGMMKR